MRSTDVHERFEAYLVNLRNFLSPCLAIATLISAVHFAYSSTSIPHILFSFGAAVLLLLSTSMLLTALLAIVWVVRHGKDVQS